MITLSLCVFLFQKNADVVEELLVVLRNQQRELTELRSQIESMQSCILSQVEHVLTKHQEQERILFPIVHDFCFWMFPFCVQTYKEKVYWTDRNNRHYFGKMEEECYV